MAHGSLVRIVIGSISIIGIVTISVLSFSETELDKDMYVSHVMRKPVFGGFDQV